MNSRRPERRTSSVEFVTTALYMDILEGVHAPGSFLRLNDVAEQLGVSMMPVREAIRELAALGLVEAIPHRGAQVRHLSIDDLVETYHGRLHLETLALKLGAPSFTAERADQAWRANERRLAALAAQDAYANVTEHEALHFLLYESCQSPWIVKALLPGWRNAARYRGSSLLDTHVRGELDDQHALLIEAMTRHDGDEAVALLHTHLTSAAEAVAQELGGVSILDRLPALAELR
ncbi:GntR family transcriptional regulator [Leucobacter albus]|uniref:GntR family transcriptional regulator n=1 Tax=Leucobacter albus TaxID=272210 RepID=A0ABW3TQ14_9MICO